MPFLFKVLSINQALSIQAHPNKQLARQLHTKDPKNYPDSNHKPEMLVAISENFEALCGFRTSREIVENFVTYPELVSMCDKENCDEFITLLGDSETRKENFELSLRKCFTSLMNKPESFMIEELNKLKQKLEAKEKRSDLDSLFLNLIKQYSNDVGCFSIYLLNYINLKKGEAIFLSANVPHAYLFGDGVECMACSDNVVRAGLTPKFKDVKVLCDMLDYSMRSSEENKLEYTRTNLSLDKDYLKEYRPSVDEFSVQEIRIKSNHLSDESQTFLIPRSESGSILIVIEVDTDNYSSQFEASNAKNFLTKQGLVYFIDSSNDVSLVISKNENSKNDANKDSIVFLAFRAYCDIKNI